MASYPSPHPPSRAELHFYQRPKAVASEATIFALLTEHGIYHGGLHVRANVNQAPSECILDPGLLPSVACLAPLTAFLFLDSDHTHKYLMATTCLISR